LLACALWEEPDEFIVRAFADAGVTPAGLRKLAEQLVQSLPSATPVVELPPLFLQEQLNLAVFGPVAKEALRMMAPLCAIGERRLRDTDLLRFLLSQSDSLLVEWLHVKGANVARIRQQLGMMASAATPPANVARSATEIPREKMSRLLAGVFQRARELASHEACSVISESQLVRAHLMRVGDSAASLYDSLGIETVGLRRYLERYPADRTPLASPTRHGKIEDIEGYLRQRVINQEDVVKAVVPALRRIRLGMNAPGRPMGVFLFLGATGVGKTELARAIAEVAFGTGAQRLEFPLIKIDCGNFTEPGDVVQLLGARQGLVGYKEGQLTNGLRDKPHSVVLFDECEKAHAHIWQSLLPFFDEGVVREPDGTEYDATSCILVATSNLGYKEAMARFDLWQATEGRQAAMQQTVEEFVLDHVQRYFSPEFLGRFGRENVLFFRHFDLASYRAIVQLKVAQLTEEMAQRGLEVVLDGEEVIEQLAALAWEARAYGARPVNRLLARHLRDQMVAALERDPERTRFVFAFRAGAGQIVLEAA
jgi:ATP-dependent Clp protease ATP-binding subunit ClpA